MSRQAKNRKKAARTKAAKASTSPAKHFMDDEKASPFPHMQRKAAWMIPKRTKKGWWLKGNNNPKPRAPREVPAAQVSA